MLHGRETGKGPGVVLLHVKFCLFLWPDSENSCVQLRQYLLNALWIDSNSRLQDGQKNHTLLIPKDYAYHLACRLLCLKYFFWTIRISQSSFSKLSVTSPTSQLILQPFRRFTYVTAHFSTIPLLHLHHSSFSKLLSLLLRHRLFTFVTWRAAHVSI